MLSKESVDRISKLRDKHKTEDEAEIVRRALRLYETLIKEMAAVTAGMRQEKS